MSEFKGEAGRIYVEKTKQLADLVDGKVYEVWFEGLVILGVGTSELDALQDAARHTANISLLIATALATASAQAASGG